MQCHSETSFAILHITETCVPVMTESSRSKLAEAILKRTTVHDARGRLAGYEFHLSDPHHDGDLLGALTRSGIDSLDSRRFALVVDRPCQLTDRDWEVAANPQLILALPDADFSDTQDLGEQIQQRQVRLAIDGYRATPAQQALLPKSELVILDFSQISPPDIVPLTQACQRAHPSLQMMARNLSTEAEVDLCRKLRYRWICGPAVLSRSDERLRKVDPSRKVLIQLLNAVRQEAETHELAALFKTDPALTFKLLRNINSVGEGLLNRVSTLEHALMVLGRTRLYRWLAVLLLTQAHASPREEMFMEAALVRGRLMELVAENRLTGPERDNLFVAGMFSLLDEIFQMSMFQAIGELNLPEPIYRALVYEDGPYAVYLVLAKACESGDATDLKEPARVLGLSPEEIAQAHICAVVWAQTVGR